MILARRAKRRRDPRDRRLLSGEAAEFRHADAFGLLERPVQTLARAEADAGRNDLDRFARCKQEPLGGLNPRVDQVLMWR